MNARTRILGAAVALIMTLGGIVAIAPGASAAPSGADFTDNHNGTVSVKYRSGGFDQGIYFCNPSWTGADLSPCNLQTSAYAISRASSLLSNSPAELVQGMTVIHKVFQLPRVPLPAGYYTLVMVFQSTEGGPDIYIGGIQNVLIGELSAGPTIPPWVKAVGRHAADGCDTGWGASWQEWAIPVMGGYVCSREIP